MDQLQALTDAQARNEAARLALSDAQKRLNESSRELQRLQAALADPLGRTIKVTDHAIVRYAERVLGMNTEEIRRNIASQIAPYSWVLGDGKFPMREGMTAIVTEKTVVTIVNSD